MTARRLKLLLLLILNLLATSCAWATDYCADANVVGCWPMNADESPVDDKTANANDGTHQGTPVFATADPPDTGDGTASNYQTGYWELAGDNTDYFNFGSGSSLNVSGQTFSSVMWFYENLTGWQYWDNKYTSSPSTNGWNNGIANGTVLEMNVYSGGTRYDKTGSNPLENQWEHVAYVLESDDDMCIYLNGTSSCTNKSGANIGSTSGISLLNGKQLLRLCQYAMFNDALTSTEVNDIKDNGLGYVEGGGASRRIMIIQ